MVFEEILIQWTSDGETHTIHIDSTGRPTIDEEPPPARTSRRPGPPRRGQSWTEEEESVIAAKLNSVDDAPAIAEELGRTRGAVLARAVKLGLLDPGEVTLRFAGS
jgi:hypothetical protein